MKKLLVGIMLVVLFFLLGGCGNSKRAVQGDNIQKQNKASLAINNTKDIQMSDVISNNGKDVELHIDYGKYSDLKILPDASGSDYIVKDSSGDGIAVSFYKMNNGMYNLYFDYYVENNDKNNAADGMINTEITIYDENNTQISDGFPLLCYNKIDPGTNVKTSYIKSFSSFEINKNTKISKIYIKLL